MTCLALVPTVLLVYYCKGVCASQESDLVVLTTASRLREEIRSQLNETELCTCQPQNCTSLHEDLLDKIEERVTDSVKEVKDLLSQLFHLLTPGHTFSHPATSSWPHNLPQVSTGSGELTMDPNTCTVTWRGAAKV